MHETMTPRQLILMHDLLMDRGYNFGCQPISDMSKEQIQAIANAYKLESK